jgi:quinol monooxygenase YgiN
VAKFIQIIEYKTSRINEIDKMLDEFVNSTQGRRTTSRVSSTADRDQPNTYMDIVEFPSYDDAEKNNKLPEVQQISEQMAKLTDGPPIFRNLDVRREVS